MRAFLAIELPVSVRAELARLQQYLQQSRADVKWVEAHNLHLTLRFLGDLSDQQRAAVELACRRVAASSTPVTLSCSDVGAFPSLSAPRVIWVGLIDDMDVLTAMAEQVEAELIQAGFSEADKPFSAHVTIGRVRSPRGQSELVRAMRSVSWIPVDPFTVDHLTLFRSDLSSTGPTYSVVATFPFTAIPGTRS